MRFTKGDIVKVNLNPSKGHEQASYRPVLVLNERPLPGDINIIAPITTKAKDFPFEVELPRGIETTGVVLCFQIRTLDLAVREAVFVEKAPSDTVNLCVDYINRLLN